MNKISIPYHLIIPSLICLIAIILILRSRKKLFTKDRLLWISILCFCFIYLFFVGSSAYADIYYQLDLNKYDLDKNGFFSSSESTTEQKNAMQKLSSDLGRNLSVFIGFIFAIILASFIYIFGFIAKKIRNNKNHT
jgi:hypothetical protein